MKTFLAQIAHISFDTAEVKANSLEEALLKIKNNEYELVGPDGFISLCRDLGISFDQLREMGISESVIDSIRSSNLDKNSDFFESILSIEEA